MVEIASITALIQKSRTVIKYLKDVQDAPKERNELMRELRHMEIHLSTVKIITSLSTAGDPWLMILQQLNDPFKELSGLLAGIEKDLKVTSLWWKRVAPRLQWSFAEERAQEDLRKVEDIGSLVMDVVGQHEALAFSLNVQQKLCDLEGKVDAIRDVAMSRQRDKKAEVAAWLSPLDYSSIQRGKLKQHVAGTGQWFLEALQFTSWLDGTAKSSTLWCPGDPGTGKTVLASVVVAHLCERTEFSKEYIPVLRVFRDYQTSDAKTVPDIIRSLLKQLIYTQNELSSTLESMHTRSLKGAMDPSLGELMEVLSLHLEGYPYVYIIFDAFDEFVDNQKELVSALKSFGNRVRLLVTSRNKPAIQRLFQEDEELPIRADDGDIRKLVMSRLRDNDRLRIFVRDCDALRQNILAMVVEKAQGMFLLADAHLSLFAHSEDRGDLIEKLQKLPEAIASTYAHLLERAEHQTETEKTLAYKIFGLVAFSQRPLTIPELQYALAVQVGTKKLNRHKILDFDLISSACVGLVVVDGEEYVRFAHPTFREYILSQQAGKFAGIHEHITRLCLTYMSFDVFRSPNVLLSDISAKYPFLKYASNHWAVHARKCARGSVEEEILTFLETRTQIALSFEQPPDSEPEIPRTLAWFAAHHGLVHVMQILLDRGVDPQHENTLCVAAHAGQISVVKLLLSRDDVDMNQANKVTCLRHYQNGIEVKDAHPTFCTPLVAAASNGHERTVKMLLKSRRMASLNFLPPDGPTALSAAVLGNHVGVVKLLLRQPGIDTSIRILDETPLMLAKRMGRDDVVKMFLERGDGDEWSVVYLGSRFADYLFSPIFTNL
ncbi:uncharacterized protein EV420DRAFT_1584987 [Desarmillaria tabescens]|uniref:NACHT domain-containing protein n=1 Tax=Armillaria tabescens TaxID=1929756 RepID=A0AA39JB29_ARMTA|nr:uncharacterized protein EV420DRAFT_1584987 [Desarmillaria tabescens]KAK0439049.1 hypothetical protein EV420DRAFT_1584987 [Desarmillaria tabescens]